MLFRSRTATGQHAAVRALHCTPFSYSPTPGFLSAATCPGFFDANSGACGYQQSPPAGRCQDGINGNGLCVCNSGFNGNKCQYSNAVTCSGSVSTRKVASFFKPLCTDKALLTRTATAPATRAGAALTAAPAAQTSTGLRALVSPASKQLRAHSRFFASHRLHGVGNLQRQGHVLAQDRRLHLQFRIRWQPVSVPD